MLEGKSVRSENKVLYFVILKLDHFKRCRTLNESVHVVIGLKLRGHWTSIAPIFLCLILYRTEVNEYKAFQQMLPMHFHLMFFFFFFFFFNSVILRVAWPQCYVFRPIEVNLS